VAQFTADIAGTLELFAIAAGLVLLHRAQKEAPAKLLEAAPVAAEAEERLHRVIDAAGGKEAV